MVVAGDDWVSIMYRTMEATSRFSAVFFVALIVLGQVSKEAFLQAVPPRISCFQALYRCDERPSSFAFLLNSMRVLASQDMSSKSGAKQANDCCHR